MQLATSVSAIGLYAYHRGDPGIQFYKAFYRLILDQFHRLGIEPTYIGASTKIGSGKFRRFGGRVHTKLLESEFKNLVSLSIAANPPGSDAPAFDKYFDVSVGYKHPTGEVLLSYVINESYLLLDSAVFVQTFNELAMLYAWDFGFGFSDIENRQPELHIIGSSDGRLPPDEEKALDIWYNTPPEVRVQKLRSVYPYNILNQTQLSQEVEQGVTLKDYIQQQLVGTLEPLGDGRLQLWKIGDPQQRNNARNYLKRQGLVIS